MRQRVYDIERLSDRDGIPHLSDCIPVCQKRKENITSPAVGQVLDGLR